MQTGIVAWIGRIASASWLAYVATQVWSIWPLAWRMMDVGTLARLVVLHLTLAVIAFLPWTANLVCMRLFGLLVGAFPVALVLFRYFYVRPFIDWLDTAGFLLITETLALAYALFAWRSEKLNPGQTATDGRAR